MSFLDKIRACNRWDPADYVPFRLGGARIGSLRPAVAEALGRWPERFAVAAHGVRWLAEDASVAERTAILDEVSAALLADGLLSHLQGERYPVTVGARAQALALVDRAAAPLFGMRAFGQHLNGFVRTPDGIEMWIGRRAADRRHYPGKLDHLVAGGLPHGLTLAENLRKECAEEAGIPPELADRARPVGIVTYCRTSAEGLKPDTIYCYDLELPADFVPRCADGEVERFERRPAAEVAALVRDTDAFKLNCNLVIVDFLMRQGLLDPEDPDYLALARELRAPLP